MARYGMDYGRRDIGEGYGRNRGPDMGNMGYGGMRSDGWGSNWRDFPGEGGWFGEGFAGYPGGGYDVEYGGGFRGGQEMRGGGYGAGGYGGREMGYGPGDYEMGRGGYRTSETNIGGRGGWQGGRGAERTRASQIMTENPEAVTPDTSLADVAKKMKELDVGIIPVIDSTEGRRLQGVITDRDIAIRAVAEGKDGKAKVSDCMTAAVETVNKNDSVREVLDVMSREQVRRVPVTDREGRLVGIIAQADLAVDYAENQRGREIRVEDTIERISEPARPRRGSMAARGQTGMSAGGRQGRGTQTGG